MDAFKKAVILILLHESYAVSLIAGTSCSMNSAGNKIDCSRANLTSIPTYFKNVTNKDVIEIDFSYNMIDYIKGNFFRGFTGVQVFRLTSNVLNETSLNNVFRGMPKLRELYLEQNKFSHVPSQLFKNMSYLSKLYLDGNCIERIDKNAFKGLTRLKLLRLRRNSVLHVSDDGFRGLEKTLRHLNMKGNRLKVIPKAIKSLKQLISIELSENKIKTIQSNSFSGMSSLRDFRMFVHSTLYETRKRRKFTIKVDKNAFRRLRSLKKLNLDSPFASLDSFPNLDGTDNLLEISLRSIYNLTIPQHFCSYKAKLEIIRIRNSTIFNFPKLNNCSSLRYIDLEENTISYIPKDAFSGLQYITSIDILQRHNTVKRIDKDAFSNLPSLKELDLSHYFLNTFPNLNGTRSLLKLKLQFCNISVLPAHICHVLPNLENLDLSENYISTLPDFSKCQQLKVIDLLRNQIKSIQKQFNHMKELKILTLSDNHLSLIQNNTFKGCQRITNMYLDWNMIHTIEENAFKDIHNLEVLNVSYNKLKKLPSRGIRSLVVIDAVKNDDLLSFPPQESLPYARQLRLPYPYHCCFFMQRVRTLQHIVRTQKLSANSTWVIETHGDYSQILSKFNATRQREIEPRFMEPLLRKLNENATKLIFYPAKHKPRDDYKGLKGSFISDDSYCIPESNEFFPCESLMGREWLRICVWLVIFLAVMGNIFVLIVLTVNYAKLDVPRFLIINLAFADLCLGIYLALLAFVDLFTLGDFRLYGLEWQFSPSCKGAGFLAVFASELSVYTLSAITIERFTTIKNSMHIEKRMTKKHAVIIMAVGWIFSVVLAALPLYSKGKIRFSDYSKYSICLPFDTDTLTSKAYVTFVLMFNLVAFILILACYVKIYLFISGSHAWNSGDARIARRMAILVFTDFLCWFPITLIALSAVYKNSLVEDLWISKVLTIFVFPLNACANPFLYAILTKTFRKDIMLFVRHVKGKSIQREIRKSLLKAQFKNSLTYSTSVRRGSSFSFLFGRRCSSKTDEIKLNTRIIPVQEPIPLPSDELENEESESNQLIEQTPPNEVIFEQKIENLLCNDKRYESSGNLDNENDRVIENLDNELTEENVQTDDSCSKDTEECEDKTEKGSEMLVSVNEEVSSF